MARIVTVGEGMLELAGGPPDWRLGTAGDVLNTSVHLARAGHQLSFLTAVGEDPFSRDMVHQWQEYGIDTSLVLANPRRGPGLYAVSLDRHGERSFTYWRDSSAAKSMFDLPGSASALKAAADCDLLYFSLITLAILPPLGRDHLFSLAERVRAKGGTVAFDSNYRAALWPNAEAAREARDRAIALATTGLPTLEDEAAIEGTPTTAEAVSLHWASLGCNDVIVKMGPDGCRMASGALVAPPTVLTPVDTSGAGDAFNGGYLAARLNGASIEEAVMAGHDLAGWTIMHRGAIPPPRDAKPL